METKDNAHFYIVAAKGWIEKDGKYLLARRGPEELHMPGVWSLPGGKVETETEEAHIIEKTLRLVPPHLEDVHQSVVGAGNGLESLDARELPLKRPGAAERVAPHGFDRAECAENIARQPHFTIAAPPDGAKNLVIGNAGRR